MTAAHSSARLTLSTALILTAIAAPAQAASSCDSDLERAAAARLSAADGPWLLQCADADTLEVVRVLGPGRTRARTISLAGVSPELRLEVVVLAVRALLRPALVPQEPEPPPPGAQVGDPPGAAREASPGARPQNRPGTPPGTPLGPAPGESPRVDVIIVPGLTAPTLLRSGLWQDPPPPELRPILQANLRWFPAERTWLAGASLGVDRGPLRAIVRAAGTTADAEPLRLQLLVVEGAVSAALACLGSATWVGCLRAEGGAGAGWLQSSSEKAGIATGSGSSAWAQGSVGLEVDADWSPLLAQASVTVGGALGPRAQVAGNAGPAWAGLLLGLGLGVSWR